MDQIYTVTTDNGANMLKAVRMLASNEDCDDILEQTEDNTNDIDCDVYLKKDKEKDDEIDETEYLNVFENIEIESDDINSNFQNNFYFNR